jgi:hypothetical protein
MKTKEDLYGGFSSSPSQSEEGSTPWFQYRELSQVGGRCGSGSLRILLAVPAEGLCQRDTDRLSRPSSVEEHPRLHCRLPRLVLSRRQRQRGDV